MFMTPKAPHAERALARTLLALHPVEAAAILEGHCPEDVAATLDQAPAGRILAVVEGLSPESAAQALRHLRHEHAAYVLSNLPTDRTANLMSRLAAAAREPLLALVPPAVAEEIQHLMQYPESTAGRLMDPAVVSFRTDATADHVIAGLRTLRARRIATVYVVDENGVLAGAIPLQDVVLASPASKLADLIVGPPPAVQALAPQDEIVEVLSQHRLTSLPVVDFERRLLGVLHHEALIRAAREDASADLQTMVGVSPSERALSKAHVAVRKRLPWLNVNLVSAFLAASVVGLFEGTISRFTALAVLMPVVSGQSGNTGAQALAVTMRGLALREVRPSQWRRLVLKELATGMMNGLAIALVTALGVYVWSRSFGLAAVIAVAMVLSMSIAGVSGAAIPMVLSRLGQDPAQSSSIILTAVTDIIGFSSFLGLATLFAAFL
jgi:magnesium transporter